MEERTNNPAARLYRSMYLIRRVEEEIIRLYPTDKIKSPVHLSIGQEAVSAAVCDHLRAVFDVGDKGAIPTRFAHKPALTLPSRRRRRL